MAEVYIIVSHCKWQLNKNGWYFRCPMNQIRLFILSSLNSSRMFLNSLPGQPRFAEVDWSEKVADGSPDATADAHDREGLLLLFSWDWVYKVGPRRRLTRVTPKVYQRQTCNTTMKKHAESKCLILNTKVLSQTLPGRRLREFQRRLLLLFLKRLKKRWPALQNVKSLNQC